jgi:hypothetical protein
MAPAIMEKNGVEVEVLRPVDYDIAYGVGPVIRAYGGPTMCDWASLRRCWQPTTGRGVVNLLGQIPRS